MENNFFCQKCGGKMIKGFVADKSETRSFPTYWIEGEPVNATLFGLKGDNLDVSGRNKFMLRALRCEKCGFAEIYAV